MKKNSKRMYGKEKKTFSQRMQWVEINYVRKLNGQQ